MIGSRLPARAFAAILAVLVVYVTGEGDDTYLWNYKPADSESQAPWDGALAEEREGVLKWFLSLPRTDFSEESALGYLERQGFRLTEISGPIVLDEGESPRLVAFREGRSYALSLPAVEAPLFPGLYWTSGFGTAWTVIEPGGTTTTYWVDREL